ncbi:DUF2635 domain-containing protein [Escherichia coli]|nr:DUF2635 domain-containing protein [Escherichia coli]
MMLKIKPAAGKAIRDPLTMKLLASEGEEKPVTVSGYVALLPVMWLKSGAPKTRRMIPTLRRKNGVNRNERYFI